MDKGKNKKNSQNPKYKLHFKHFQFNKKIHADAASRFCMFPVLTCFKCSGHLATIKMQCVRINACNCRLLHVGQLQLRGQLFTLFFINTLSFLNDTLPPIAFSVKRLIYCTHRVLSCLCCVRAVINSQLTLSSFLLKSEALNSEAFLVCCKSNSIQQGTYLC